MFPEVVETYGEFSSELLQAMLGIPAVPKTTTTGENRVSEKETNVISHLTETKYVAEQVKKTSFFDFSDERTQNRPSRQIYGELSTLSPDAQAIVFAGKIGLPVKAIVIEAERGITTFDEATRGSQSSLALEERDRHSSSALFYVPHTAFELDAKREQEERESDREGSHSILIEPNAPLIRSMRRCERRLPSILDHWAIVDVALTQYELVYFDVIAFDLDGLDQTDRDKICAVRDALIATRGGKKLRLRDVAYGRKIVGHIDLSKVDYVKLLRFLPVNELDDTLVRSNINSEYWKPETVKPAENVDLLASNKRRWECVQEDVVKIHWPHGVVLLRFFSDLENQEHADESVGKVSEPMALLWCQTIGRICGRAQLKQDLPHFGQQG